MEPATSPPTLRFGPFAVNIRTGELRKNGFRIRLQEQPLRVLAFLMERQGQLVTREELKKHLWPDDTFVDYESGLNAAVSKLRDSLSDNAGKPRYVETIPRRGYRFLVPVELVEGSVAETLQIGALALSSVIVSAADASSILAQSNVESPEHRLDGRSWRFAGMLAGAAMLVCLLAAYARWQFDRGASPTAEQPIRSIAVLPFDNFSGDPSQDYFADGMTDELITDLAQLASLRVTSRTSVMQYKGTHKPMAQIRKDLHVDVVVEGSVIRTGNSVKVNAQLIETSDDRHLWAQSFTHSEEDVAALQDDVAQAVAERVQVAIDPSLRAHLASAPPAKAEAYEAYLHGLSYLQHHSDADLLKSLDYFKESVSLDPTLAVGYGGMAQTYCLLGDYGVLHDDDTWPQAEVAARQALVLDDSLSSAHAALAFALWRYNWDWNGAAAEFQKALALSPSDGDTHHLYGVFLATKGDFASAERELRDAEDLDPLSLIIRTNIGWLSYYRHDFPTAIADYQKVLQDDSAFVPAQAKLWIAYACEGDKEHATMELENFFRFYKIAPPALDKTADPDSRFRTALLSYVKSGQLTTYERARFLALAGQNREALEALQEAKSRHDGWLVYAGIEPAFDALRSSLQFQQLLQSIGLPSRRPTD
jgi:TolB-like protein/DNA-binding winged helix-turn-helix (wHTH) protein